MKSKYKNTNYSTVNACGFRYFFKYLTHWFFSNLPFFERDPHMDSTEAIRVKLVVVNRASWISHTVHIIVLIYQFSFEKDQVFILILSKKTSPSIYLRYPLCKKLNFALTIPYPFPHEVRINKEYTIVYIPSSELGLSQPLSRHRVCPSAQNRGGGHTRQGVRGWGSPNSDDWRKS